MLKTSNSKSGHRLARPWGGWLRVAALTAGVAAASTAQAQDAGVPGKTSGGVSVATPGRSVELRTTSSSYTEKQHWISHQDCVDDAVLTFRVAVNSAMAGKHLVAYVGRTATLPTATTPMTASCLSNSSRTSTTVCSGLPVSASDTGSPIVVINAKSLITKFGIDGCDGIPSDGSTAPISLQFYFLVEPGANDLVNVEGTTYKYAIYEGSGIDLWGPAAPTGVNPISSDESLDVEFSASLGADTVAGYHFFIDDGLFDGGTPPPAPTNSGSTSTSAGASSSTAASSGAGGSTSTSTGTGTSTSAGVGGGTSTGAGTGGAMSTATGAGGGTSTSSGTSSTAGGAGGVSDTVAATGGLSTGVTGIMSNDECNPSLAPACTAASSVLFAGQVPGEGVKPTEDVVTSTTGRVEGLKNGRAYVVAVAAFDDVGNIGKLSELSCGTPQPLDVFLRVNKCKGGLTDSGCGFCSVGGDRGGSFAALVSAGLFVFGFAARRSRRPRAERGGR